MAEYDRAIATSLRLIAKKGVPVIWRKKTVLTPDPSKPWLVEAGPFAEYTPSVVFLPFTISKPSLNSDNEFVVDATGGEAETGKCYGLMGAQGFAPDTADTVIHDSIYFKIEKIDVLAPNGQIILYTITFNG